MYECKSLEIGWAQTDITPPLPFYLQGQFYDRIARYVHDPITATALAISGGDEQVVFVSLDMPFTSDKILAAVRKRLENEPGLDAGKISFGATHTHNSISTDGNFLMGMYEEIFGADSVDRPKPPDNLTTDKEISEFLIQKLTDLIKKAWREKAPGGVSHAQDYAAVAFNRRVVYKDGKTVMYGACSREDFIRLEGCSDHTTDMLYTWDERGDLTGVACCIPCPSQVMELHYFVSADYWAEARDSIREELGNVYVLPMCGAAGDQNPLDMVRLSKTNEAELQAWGAQTGEVFRNFDMKAECEGIGERIAEAVRRGYGKARNRISSEAVFAHEVKRLSLPIRTVTEAEYLQCLETLEAAKLKYSPGNKLTVADMVPLFREVGTVLRWREQRERTAFEFDVHAVRIGNAAFATNPFELFTEYGMRMKARSPAEQTFVVQLSNGCGMYLPTEAALGGGSYSSTVASALCGPKEGDALVEETLRALRGMWE